MNKILIDANVLLHGAFTPLSTSRSMLSNFIKHKGIVYIHNYTLNECLFRIRECESIKKVSLRRIFDLYFQRLNVIILKDNYTPAQIKTEPASGYGDKLISKVAREYHLPICTLNFKDFAKCMPSGITILSPMDIQHKLVEPTLAMIAQGNLGHKEGTVLYSFSFYFDIYTSGFSFIRFLLSENIGNFTLDIKNEQLVLFEGLKYSKAINLRGRIIKNNPIKFILTYNKHQIDAYASQGSWISKTTIPENLTSEIPKSRLTIHGDEFKGGHIQYLHQHIRYLREKSVNKILRGDATELPWDRINLETVVELFYK